MTLPVSLLGYIAACLWLNGQTPDFSLPFGPRPCVFIGLMVAIAVLWFVGGGIVLEHRQPKAANGDPRAVDCIRDAGGTAVYLYLAP